MKQRNTIKYVFTLFLIVIIKPNNELNRQNDEKVCMPIRKKRGGFESSALSFDNWFCICVIKEDQMSSEKPQSFAFWKRENLSSVPRLSEVVTNFLKSKNSINSRLILSYFGKNYTKALFESYNNLPIKVLLPSSTLPAVVNRNNWLFSSCIFL